MASKHRLDRILKQILDGHESSSMLVISHCERTNRDDLMKMVIRSVLKNESQKVSLLLLDSLKNNIISAGFDQIIDFFSHCNVKEVLRSIDKHQGDILVIDCLNPLLLAVADELVTINELRTFIRTIKKAYKRCICIYNEKLSTETAEHVLRCEASTIAVFKRIICMASNSYQLQLTHKRPNHKVRWQIYQVNQQITIDIDGRFQVQAESNVLEEQDQHLSTDVSFSLHLGDEEEETRLKKEQVLPYMR